MKTIIILYKNMNELKFIESIKEFKINNDELIIITNDNYKFTISLEKVMRITWSD